MPLVLICGFPCSGKTKIAHEIKEYLENEQKKKVIVVSENDLVAEKRNEIYSDFTKEKEIRSALKAKVEQLLTRDCVIILDGLNYIKGFRYELYCIVKSQKTLHAVVQSGYSKDLCKKWNASVSALNQYDENVFNELIQRFEEPDSRNRWDSPLFICSTEIKLQMSEIYNSLFDRVVPPPNQSTISQPKSSGSFMHTLDQTTQNIILEILDIQKTAFIGDSIKLKECDEKVVLMKKYTMSDLRRVKQQFINYTKMHPIEDVAKLRKMFILFINNSVN
ncbi:protein KTI12 homolog [Hydra vulgaris]|uniref:Protein KTI12 homolog n=1 Tax=Hydra vulgaris TaxID=6087 RepID=T2M886_HYDVU|nr:protein KTI12 homolog [Hydra vulgaris]